MKHRWATSRDHLGQTIDHHCLDSHAQFPPATPKLKGLAASFRGGEAEVHFKFLFHIQMVQHLDALSPNLGWQQGA